ncbi:MAG TPA: hypothetical protein VIW21_11665 [Chthoniobacterales bacterium]
MPKRTFTDWVQFAATIVSPLLLAWLGWVTQQHEKTLERHDKLIRQQFEESGTRFEHAHTIFSDLTSGDLGKKRLAVLASLAFIHEHQLPEFLLPVIAINESSDEKIAADLRQGLRELIEAEGILASTRTAATRALSLLEVTGGASPSATQSPNPEARANAQTVLDVADNLVHRASSSEVAPQEQAQAKKQYQQLTSVVTRVAVSGPDEGTKARAAAILANAPLDDPKRIEQAVAAFVSSQPDQQAPIRSRVYLHIADDKQRSKAEEFKRSLIKAGYLVPGIQNVGGKADIPDKLEVRYFARDSEPEAKKILGMLEEKGVTGKIHYNEPSVSDQAISSDVKTHFEIWASKSSP